MTRTRRAALLAASLLISALFALGAPTAFAAPSVAAAKTAAGAHTHPFIPGPGSGSGIVSALGVEPSRNPSSTSTNWSGYTIQTAFPTGQTNSVSDVKGTWVVPTVLGGTNSGAYSSNWVGIDGYSSNSVEQLGTEQDWSGGVAQYSAWYEMYPAYPVTINTISVHPGDVITAEVKWVSGNTFTLSMSNATTGQNFSTTQALGGTAARSSAEWIVEAPSSRTGVLPLPTLSPSTFSNCSCTANGTTGPISGAGWQYDAMTMTDPTGSSILQVPSALTGGGTGFVMSRPNSDGTPPTTSSDALLSYNNTATIHLTATDNSGGSGVAATYYQLDGGSTVAGTVITVSTYGNHTLRYWSIDNAGNQEAANTKQFTINDTIPPVTTSSAVATYTGTANITLSATDNTGGSGVATTHYNLDGAGDVVGTSVGTSALGPHTLSFYSLDNAGNHEATKTATFVVNAIPVDSIPPTTTADVVPNYNNTATIHLTAVDNPGGSGVAATFYQLDGGTTQTGTVLTVSTYGSHSLVFWSRDNANNTESPHTDPFIVNDTIAPTTTSNAVSTYVGSATILLTANDNPGGSGVANTFYSLDGGSPAIAGTSVTVTAAGSHTLSFYSVDIADNFEVAKTVGFSVLSTAAPAPTLLSKSPGGSRYVIVRHHGVAYFNYSATLTSTTGVPISGVPVVCQRSANGVTWSTAGTKTTNAAGTVSITLAFKGAGTGYWRWYFPGNSTWATSSTTVTQITVQ